MNIPSRRHPGRHAARVHRPGRVPTRADLRTVADVRAWITHNAAHDSPYVRVLTWLGAVTVGWLGVHALIGAGTALLDLAGVR